ncbi:MAG: glycosyltransferase [Pseudomonadota bacterium]
MKVLHVIPSIAAVHGGPSRAALLMEKVLLQQNVQVEIAATSGSDYRATELVAPAPGLTHHLFRRLFDFYKTSPALVTWLWKHVADYDLVHIHALFSFSSTAAAMVARMRGVPYIVRPLGTLASYGREHHRPLLKRLSIACLEGSLLRHAAAVHFTADSEQAEAATLGIAFNSVVLPLGIESEPAVAATVLHTRFPQCIGKQLVLFLSRLDPKKNIEGLLQAFAQVKDAFPDVMLVVAGQGTTAYEAKLRQLATQLSLGDRVCWTGQVEGELKSSLLRAAAVFVLPSWSENFGIAAVEALMAGLPCVLGEGVAVAADVGAAGAGLVVTTQPSVIADALTTLLTDAALRESMGQRASALARRQYSADAMGSRLVTLYESVIAAHTADVKRN